MEKDIEIFNRIAQKVFNAEKSKGVVKPRPYDDLEKILDLDLDIKASDDDSFEKALTDLILTTPKTTTKKFFNQLFGGRRSRATLGELLAVLLNNSMYTYKVGGPMIKMEQNIFKAIHNLVGFEKPTFGTIAPGGSMTNLMGLIMARDKYDDQSRYKGKTIPLVGYSSKESHYSLAKNAAFCGIGRENIRYIESDEFGKLRVDILEQKIKEDIGKGLKPFFVNATAGTTVMGAYDDLSAIGELCKKFDLWFHVDGAYGAAVMFSDKLKHLIEGAKNADSFTFNAHKMLGTPITCSIILSPHRDCLYNSFSNRASYLFQSDEDDINPGKISLQCGRRNDALKFWTLWKSLGTEGLGKMVEHEFALADYARNYIRNNKDYTLYSFDDSVNICFNYKNHSPEVICDELYKTGKMMVGYGKFKKDTFIRLVTVNGNNSQEDILNVFKTIEDFGES